MRFLGLLKKRISFIILGLILLVGCHNKKETAFADSPTNKWIADAKNSRKKEYKTVFYKKYADFLKKNEIDSARLILKAYSYNLDRQTQYDAVYLKTVVAFLSKYDAQHSDLKNINLYYSTGYQYRLKDDFQESKKWFEYIIQNANQLKGATTLSSAYLQLGNISYIKCDYDHAISHYNLSANLYEQREDWSNASVAYANIANCYYELFAYNAYESNINKAIALSEKSKNENSLLYYQLNVCDYILNVKKDSVLFVKKINALAKKELLLRTKEDNLTFNLYDLQVAKSLLEKKLDSCVFFIEKMKALNATLQVSENQKMIGMYEEKFNFAKNNKIDNPQKLLDQVKLFEEDKNLYQSIGIYKLLYTDAFLKKDYKLALDYKNTLEKTNYILYQKNSKGQLFETDKKYETEKKEKLLNQQQATISKNKLLIIGLLSVLSIVILGVILYYSRKRKQEAQAETIRQEQFTFQLLQNTEEERSRIAGELHDSVNHDLLNIKNSLINGKTIEVNDVANVIEEVRNISRNLHPAVLETIGLEASIENLCERLTEVGLFTTCKIQYTQKLSKAKELQLYRIIQEALNNTLKHGKANAAKVILTSQNNSLHLELKDNGNGFDVSQQLNNPKSFGLQSIMQRAKAIAAKINIDSTNKGTVILLKIPV